MGRPPLRLGRPKGRPQAPFQPSHENRYPFTNWSTFAPPKWSIYSALDRFLYNEHFAYLVRSEEAAAQWRLKRVLAFHESRPLVTASESDEFGESLFFEMMSEIRACGVGLLLANQVPQREAEVVRSNIGTRIVMKQSSEAAVLTFRRLLKLNDQQLHKVMHLKQRQMVMQHPNVAEPFLAEVPDVYD